MSTPMPNSVIPEVTQARNTLKHTLYNLHHHPRMDHISFEAKDHVYAVDWTQGHQPQSSAGTVSVTKLYKQGLSEFNPDKCIARMRASGSITRNPLYRGKSDTEIKQMWIKARDDGTTFHERVEVYFNELALGNHQHHASFPLSERITQPEVRQFLQEAPKIRHIPFLTECLLYTDEYTRIVGSPDILFRAIDCPTHERCTTLRLALYDIKRCRRIQSYPYKNCSQGKWPATRLMYDIKYFQYALQLSIYKWMLETYYQNWPKPGDGTDTWSKVLVQQMVLFQCHPKLRKPYRIVVPNMVNEVKGIIARRAYDVLRAEYFGSLPQDPPEWVSITLSGDERKELEDKNEYAQVPPPISKDPRIRQHAQNVIREGINRFGLATEEQVLNRPEFWMYRPWWNLPARPI